MSDHQSFLKLIGMSEEAHQDEVETTSTTQSQSISRTEWDLSDKDGQEGLDAIDGVNQEITTAEKEQAELEVPAESGFEECSSTLEVNRDEILGRPIAEGFDQPTVKMNAENVEDEPTSDDHSVRVTNTSSTTESMGEFVEEASTMKSALSQVQNFGESTVIYADEDLESVGVNHAERTEIVGSVEKTEADRTLVLTRNSKIDFLEAKTKATVAFDYNEPQEEGRTAHFDYDQDQVEGRLVVLDGRSNTKAVHLKDLPLRIGRDAENNLILDDSNTSRFHAEIRDYHGAASVVDLGSTNGVKVNGLLVTEHVLKAYDIIQIGDCLLEYLPSGVLSKGSPQSKVLESTASAVDGHMKRRIIFFSVFVSIIGLALLFFSGGDKIQNAVKETSTKVAADAVANQVESMKQEIEKQFQKPIDSASASDIKKVFLSKLEGSQLVHFLPKAFRAELENISPEVVKLLLAHPSLVSDVVRRGGTPQAFDMAISDFANTLIEQQKFKDALPIADYLLKKSPSNTALQQTVSQLRQAVGIKGGADVGLIQEAGARGYQDLNDQEKEFFKFMDTFDRHFEELIAQKSYLKAKDFSKVVAEKIQEVLKADESLQRVGGPELERWDRRLAQTEKMEKDLARQAEKAKAAESKAGNEIDIIKLHLDMGEVAEARKKITLFIENYPEHPRIGEVKSLKAQLEASVEKTFDTTKSNLERFVQTESYDSAWKEFYRFSDLMPNHSKISELRLNIERATRAKSTQYYNQARVYEYEADDLLAAEQYYKRAMEAADPRGELYQKANRRYSEVKRKMIH